MTMLNLPLLLIPVLISFTLHLSAGQALHTNAQQNFWESFVPGELLRLLESSTLTTPDVGSNVAQRRSDVVSSALTLPASGDNIVPLKPNSIHKRSGSSTDNTQDQQNAPSSDEFNYDQAYEDFVRQYFSDKLEEDNDSNENHEEAQDSEEQQLETEHNSSSTETEPLSGETKNRVQRKTKEKCRRVRKNKQNCLICENALSGEKSESCSFSRESEPQKYAFERERSYKKQRDAEEPSSRSVEQTSSEEAKAAESDKSDEEINKRNIKSNRRQAKISRNSSSCIQMIKRGKICYQCVDGDGTTTKCYVPRGRTNERVDNKARPAEGKEHKVQKTQQRIYKRTISYSFEKGTNGTAANEPPVEADQEEDTAAKSSAPNLKEKIFIKVVKQNETIAE
ncbi:uncharacterized protein LOC128858377 [Anastrepha ludens]|uniref:uncharacterized protein LOC128858377 n=1 Tax=Anastrepha ludens TaxID=28586 RepID=UPI0023AE8276|nr:uncharacterized protein LOC128858377 [Anastrepha ludens]